MATAPAPCGVITITTDFGHQGPFVGVIKGCILTRFPEARLIDLTHEIVVHWPAEAGFWLARSFHYFPAGTVHMAVVDPGVGTSRHIVIARAEGHYFLAPDNGLLAPLIARARESFIVRLGAAQLARLGVHRPSATFHGRDIFAPVAAELAASRCRIEDLGEEVTSLVPSWVEEPTVESRSVSGVVITIDHFGNLITNIPASVLAALDGPAVVELAGRPGVPLVAAYADVAVGEPLAVVSSWGCIEIAVREGAAADVFAAGGGTRVSVRVRTEGRPQSDGRRS